MRLPDASVSRGTLLHKSQHIKYHRHLWEWHRELDTASQTSGFYFEV